MVIDCIKVMPEIMVKVGTKLNSDTMVNPDLKFTIKQAAK